MYNRIIRNSSNMSKRYQILDQKHVQPELSRDVRKPDFCICENKAADQLCGYCTTDQRLCFRYMDSTIPLLPKSEISSL